MKQHSFTIVLALLISIYAISFGHSLPSSGHTQFSTTAVNVPDLPVQITFVGTDDTSDGYSFKFSVANQSNDQIKDVQAYLLAVNESGDVEYAGNKRNPINLSGHQTKDWGFDLGCKLDDNSRVFVVVTEVIGSASSWKVLKAYETLDAFVDGKAYMLPKVIETKH
jgi:hypothetical protein